VLHNLLGDAASVPADAQRVEFDHAVEAAQQTRTARGPTAMVCRSPSALCTARSPVVSVHHACIAASSLPLCFLLCFPIVLKLSERRLGPDQDALAVGHNTFGCSAGRAYYGW
jgi:hypothetical protein